VTRAPRNDRKLAEARRAVRVDLLPTTDLFKGETAAFDVVVGGMGLIGRWSQKEGAGGEVTRTTGQRLETGACDLDPEKMLRAMRGTIPISIEEPHRGPRRLLKHMFPRSSDGS
jgi:hypothetical protein